MYGLIASLLVASPTITLDGRFDDWRAVEPAFALEDPAGDARAAFDVTRVSGVVEGTTVFLDLTLTEPLNLQSGPMDEGTLVISLSLPDGRVLAIDLRGRAATLDGVAVPWAVLRFNALPTYAATRQELRFDLGRLASPGDVVVISVSGSDDVEPVEVTLAEQHVGQAPETSLDRDGGLRLAVMNVLWDGHADAGRGRQVSRLLAAVDADVIALQEALSRAELPDRDEGEIPDTAAAARSVKRVLDRGLEGRWNVVADGLGCAVASRNDMQPISLGSGVRGAAAIIDADGDGISEGDPLVVSVHLKCCGFAGSPEDDQRVAEVTALVEALRPHAQKHPIIVAGDYNLVGSRRPLDMLTDAPLRLTETLPTQVGEDTAVTWRGLSPTESFWPGRLDLITHASSITAKQAFVLDTADLNDATLARHGLLASDSLASDHLLMVADLVIPDH
ncbi:MAG: endonuclease/exonuclease/phosphatase family protein [Planctomycetota bacterium]